MTNPGPTTKEQRERWKELREKATPGPWTVEKPFHRALDGAAIWADGMLVAQVAGLAGFDYANAELIAALPRLLADIDRLEAVVEAAKRYVEWSQGHGHSDNGPELMAALRQALAESGR